MKVLVTAQALILMPGIVVRLDEEQARDRKHCMQSLGDGLYRATLENHFKKGQLVEFEGEVPKQYISSCEPVDDNGRILPPASPGIGTRPAAQAHAPAVTGIDSARPSNERLDLDGMTKAQLIEFAEQHSVGIDSGMNKAQIVAVLKKKLKTEAA